MNEPTLRELQEDKRTLEDDVASMIREFSDKYCVKVDIDIRCTEYEPMSSTETIGYIHEVKASIEL